VAARRVRAVAGADRNAILRIGARQETLGRLVEGDLAARLREQVDRRRPAGRHQERIDRDGALGAAVLGWTVIEETRSLPPALTTARPGLISMPSARASSTAGPARIVAQVDDRGDVDAGLLQVDRRRIGGIIGGVDADIAPDRDAVMVEIGARRPRPA
jgi:hypothetical protein